MPGKNISRHEKRGKSTTQGSIKMVESEHKTVSKEMNHFKSRSTNATLDAQLPKRRSEAVDTHIKVVQNRSRDYKAVKTTTRNPKTPSKSVSRHTVTTANNVSRQEMRRRRTEFGWLSMVESERKNIVKEMMHYRFHSSDATLDSLIPERGGRPVRAVVSAG